MNRHTSSNTHGSDGWEYDCGFGTGLTTNHTPPAPAHPPPPPHRPPRAHTHTSSTSHGWGASHIPAPQFPTFQNSSTGSTPWSSNTNGVSWNPPFSFPRHPPAATSTPSPEANSMPSIETDDDGYFSYEPRELRTRLSENDIEYLSIPDVFHHVTLGSRLSTIALKELGGVIKTAVFGDLSAYDKVPIIKRNIMTGTRQIMIIPYKWTDYPKMAQACLQFAIDHPEYLAR